MMLRMHTRPANQGLSLALAAALLVAPAPADGEPARPAEATAPAATTPATTPDPAAKPASKSKSRSKPAAKPASTPAPASGPIDAEQPNAGDGNIPDELEPGQLGPSSGGASRQKPATRVTGTASSTRRSSVEQGLELSDQGDVAFDAGDYLGASRLYAKALELLSENESNHMTRAVVLANVVTTHEQLYASSGEVAHLKTAQRLIQEYLRACKSKHGTGCERYPETQEARARLVAISKRIDEAVPMAKKIPPEIDTAPGGKPYDLAVEQPPAPGWIGPAIAGGILLAGGGAAVAYYAATADKYGPIYPREGEVADTDGGADTDGTDTGTSTIEITPDMKGKLLMGVGVFMAAAGIGFAVLGSLRLAKHRRLNRDRAQSLAVVPAVGRGSAGLALSGRF